MRIFSLLIVLAMIIVTCAGCIEDILGDDDDDDNQGPYYPFEVTNETRYLTPGGTHIAEATVQNIGDEAICNVTCIIKAETITGRRLYSSKVSWLWPGTPNPMESVNKIMPNDVYGISATFNESLEGLDFVYDFSWVECGEDEGEALGGIVAPRRK